MPSDQRVSIHTLPLRFGRSSLSGLDQTIGQMRSGEVIHAVAS